MARVVVMVLAAPTLVAGQTISWTGSDGNWFETSANWSPDVPASASGIVQITNGAHVTVDSIARVSGTTLKLSEASATDITKLIVMNNLCIGSTCPSTGSSYTRGDPHITFAHGGQADFRGSHRASYAFVTSPGYQFAPYFQEVDFWYALPTLGLNQMIHGTFMTRASWRLRTGMGRELVLYVDAMKKGEALMRIGSADDPTALESFKLDGWATKVVDDIRVETRSLSISVESPAWTVNVTSKPIYGLIQPTVNDTHVHGRWDVDQRRLDVVITGAFPQPDAHGIVGQSYRDGEVRHGKLDDYDVEHAPERASADGMLPPMTTSAQAEGAIEGVYTDYKLPAPFSLEWTFSRYHHAQRAEPEGGEHSRRRASVTDWEGKGHVLGAAPKHEL